MAVSPPGLPIIPSPLSPRASFSSTLWESVRESGNGEVTSLHFVPRIAKHSTVGTRLSLRPRVNILGHLETTEGCFLFLNAYASQVASITADLSIGVSTTRIHLGALQVDPKCKYELKKDFWSARGGNSSQPLGRGQIPSNLPPHPPPPILNAFPHVDHTEGGDENQPHNLARNSASTANQDVVATQLAAMQQQFGVFQLVLAHEVPPPPHPAADSVPHPFNNNIIREPYPTGFRIPQLETYDGTKDPDDHLHAFYSCMQAQNASDALMCKIFPSTLRGNARTWYYSLPPRFNDAVLEVNSFDQAVGITTVISGLSHERFRDSLLKHPANTFSEIKNKMDLRRPGPMRIAAATRDHTRVEQPRFVREQRLQHQGVHNPPNRQGVGYQQAPPPLPPPLPPPARVIHMITRGLEAGGLSSKQRKLYVREIKHQNRAQKRKFDDVEWKNQPITFTSADLETVVTPHNDPLVTSVTINNCEVQRVLVDTGTAPDIMYFHCFKSLGLDPALLQRYDGPIYGFNNQPVPVEGVLTMNVAFGNGWSYVTPSVRFLVVKMASSFNIVIGRPTLTEIRAVVSQSHLCMKFPTPTGIATLRGNQEVARHCYITSVTQPQKGKAQTPEINPKRIPDDRQVMGVEIVDNRPEDETRAAPVEDVEEVQIDDRDPSRKTQIGTKLNSKERAELIAFLRANKDVFAWTSADMSGIPTSVFQHKLSTNPLKKPVAQKRRLFGGERLKVIKEEVEKLLQAGFIRRVDYSEKAALAVVTSARKLRPYFQSHPIIILTDQPLRQILQKPECSRSGKGSGAGALLIGPDGYQSEHALKFNFDATNNMAEYEALLLGLQLALELKLSAIQVYSDSQLVVNQINSICEVVDPVMVKYVALVAKLKCKFQKFCLNKIPRTENEQADSLSKFASDSSSHSRSVFVEVLDEPSFMKPRVMEISTNPGTPSWTDPILSFLRDGIVPEDKQEAMKLRRKASRYTLVNGVLYKRSFSLPLLRCLNPYKAEYALREVHEGVCGSHVGARTLAHKVLRQGYYWPNMYKDATHFVQRCLKCQFFAHLTYQPAEELTTLVAPWPFAQWGLDLLGPFVKGVGGVTHLIVGVDYFTKYGIPNQIVADNGTQFNYTSFRDFCSSYGIKLQFTSVYHPESNGMVESVNKCILEGETPYHLAFGTEAIILIEIGVPSFRVTHFDEGRNGQLLRENLDLLDDVREEARLQTLVYKQKIANFYNKRVRPRTFKVGDLVLRKAGLTGFETRFGKLAPNWESPLHCCRSAAPRCIYLTGH
ncbi:hypothetical protein SLEP1_g9399 [Rubroshorea leprosula]|uniref:Uncharacterized protein n=1 Tax=Rubroshorea leprosula TaxID=152421 RepID=A0AAV5IG10_9ROSI|nr:hypothetical protein SLEP1_g9399 [Rubroshorea leprosula]